MCVYVCMYVYMTHVCIHPSLLRLPSPHTGAAGQAGATESDALACISRCVCVCVCVRVNQAAQTHSISVDEASSYAQRPECFPPGVGGVTHREGSDIMKTELTIQRRI